MEVFPIRIEKMKRGQRLKKAILRDFSGFPLRDGDIIAVSGKILSLLEGRTYLLSSKNDFSRIVEREAEFVWDSFPNLKLSIVYGSLSPNSGIDSSNIERESIILYPTVPNIKAEEIRLLFLLYFNVYVGVLLIDSRLFPLRKGTTGVAIGFSGIIPILDDRGKVDLFGNKLKVTKRSIIDDLAAIAHLVMGESDERIPYVVIRGFKKYVTRRKESFKLSVPPTECIYFRTLYG